MINEQLIANTIKRMAELEAENKRLTEECAALRKQLISACNELMEIKR
jgi:septal ring factor EnvC (AmiA/AmiB activator)